MLINGSFDAMFVTKFNGKLMCWYCLSNKLSQYFMEEPLFAPAPVLHPVKPSETPAANRVDQGYDNVKCIVGQCYKASLWNCWRELSQVGKEESARQFLVLPTRGSLLSFALKFVAKPGVFTSPPECTMEGAQIQYFLPLKCWWALLWQVERASIFLGKFT